MALAFVFPGQGSQAVGMGRDLAAAFPAAREVFEEVDDALKQKLSKLMFEGPAEELTLTENAQPALMAHSHRRAAGAGSRGRLRPGGPRARLVAGHSLGEYGADRGAGLRPLDRRPAAEAARRGDAEGDAGRRGRHGRAARRRHGAGRGAVRQRRTDPETGEAEVCRDRQRQWRRPGGDLRRQGGGRPRRGRRARRRESSGRCRCRSPRRSIAR